jgi:hypothetical protein
MREVLPVPRHRPTAGRQRTGRNLRIGRYRAGDVASDIDVVDLVVLEVGRVGHHRQVRAIEFEAHVHLLGDAGEQLRQRLVDGVEGHQAGEPGVDVHVQLGVTGKGKKQIVNLRRC